MISLLQPRSGAIARRFQALPRSAIGGAWFFILFSLAHLAWVIGMKIGDPGGLTTLYQTTVGSAGNEVTLRAFGLAYSGIPGLLLAILQTGAVVAAAMMSLLPVTRFRRIGHGMLVGWSALWMLNLMRLAGADGAIDSYAQASLLTALFACTVYRAVTGWTPPAGRTPSDDPPHAETAALFAAITPEPEPEDAPKESRLKRWRDRFRRWRQASWRERRQRFTRSIGPALAQAAGRIWSSVWSWTRTATAWATPRAKVAVAGSKRLAYRGVEAVRARA